VAECSLDGDDVAAGRDQSRSIEVAKVVQPNLGQAGCPSSCSPAPGDGVVVHGLVSDGEQPALEVAVGHMRLDVLAEDGQQFIGQVDDAFGAVLPGDTPRRCCLRVGAVG